MHGIDGSDEIVRSHHLEHVQVIVESRPWGEGHQGRTQSDSYGTYDAESFDHIHPRMSFLQAIQHRIAE